MMLLKACRRCGGDLHESADMYGRYHQCIQCGNVVDLPASPLKTTVPATAKRAPAKTEVAA